VQIYFALFPQIMALSGKNSTFFLLKDDFLPMKGGGQLMSVSVDCLTIVVYILFIKTLLY
jgi:hypothetical protein